MAALAKGTWQIGARLGRRLTAGFNLTINVKPHPQRRDSRSQMLTMTFLISDSPILTGVFTSERIQAVTKLQRTQSSSGKDISETGAILNYGSLSTCKQDLES